MNNHSYASHVYCSEGSTSYSADSCYFKKEEVDGLVESHRPVFDQYPDICSINLQTAPYFDLCKGYREDDLRRPASSLVLGLGAGGRRGIYRDWETDRKSVV